MTRPHLLGSRVTRSAQVRPLDALAGAMETIGLDELVETAALLTRVDRKYFLSEQQASAAVARLPGSSRVLQIGSLRTFGYESVYLDTDSLSSYFGAARRRRRRFKVRTRTYLDTGEEFLEVKTRAARGRTVKDRIRRRDLGPHGGHEFVARTLAQRGVGDFWNVALTPALAGRYSRATVLLPGGSRATIDTDLRWRDGHSTRSAGAMVVVETKTAGRPCELDETLWRLGHRPARISKYGTGLALLRPDLPRGPWSRVLHRLETSAPRLDAAA